MGKRQGDYNVGEFLAIVALVLFSSNIVLTKVATSKLNINLGFLISVGMNVFFAFFLFLIQLFFFSEGTINWNTKGFFLFLIGGVFSTYLGRWFFFETIDKLGPTRASAFQVSNPLFTTLIAWIFLGETLHWIDVTAIILILVGLFFVSYIPQFTTAKKEVAAGMEQIEETHEANRSFIIKKFVQSGFMLAFLSSLSYAVGNVVRGIGIQNWQQPILGGLLGAIVGLVLHSVTNKNTRHFFKEIKEADTTGVALFALSGVITISAQISVIGAMHYIPISIANLITLSTPVLVMPISYFLFKNSEGVTYLTIMGIILVLGGIMLVVL